MQCKIEDSPFNGRSPKGTFINDVYPDGGRRVNLKADIVTEVAWMLDCMDMAPEKCSLFQTNLAVKIVGIAPAAGVVEGHASPQSVVVTPPRHGAVEWFVIGVRSYLG